MSSRIYRVKERGAHPLRGRADAASSLAPRGPGPSGPARVTLGESPYLSGPYWAPPCGPGRPGHCPEFGSTPGPEGRPLTHGDKSADEVGTELPTPNLARPLKPNIHGQEMFFF